jgi:hypothetical protein
MAELLEVPEAELRQLSADRTKFEKRGMSLGRSSKSSRASVRFNRKYLGFIFLFELEGFFRKYLSIHHLTPSSMNFFSLFQSLGDSKPEAEVLVTPISGKSRHGCPGGHTRLTG